MRLLIIEDQEELCLYIKAALEKENYAVDYATTGIEGEEKAYINNYNVILLDLNLPDKDGMEILKFLRQEEVDSSIIIITARNEVEQRVEGLDRGADDYLIKPIELAELKARIRAVIRRYEGRSNPSIEIGELTVNPKTRQASICGKSIPLSAKEFDILELLAYRYPAVVSAEDIAEYIYDESFEVYSSVLRVHMTRLRKKISNACGKDMILTMRGKGYYIWIE